MSENEILSKMLALAEAEVEIREKLYARALVLQNETAARVRGAERALSKAKARVSEIMDQVDEESKG